MPDGSAPVAIVTGERGRPGIRRHTGVYRAAVADGRLDPEAILSRIPMRRLAEAEEGL